MTPNELALFYSSQHIYLQTSYVESCSNALLEAISSQLYPIVPSNSSHPELIPLYGSMYNSDDEILQILDQISVNESLICNNNSVVQASYYNIKNIAASYLEFAASLTTSKKSFVRLKVSLIYVFYISYQVILRITLFIFRSR